MHWKHFIQVRTISFSYLTTPMAGRQTNKINKKRCDVNRGNIREKNETREMLIQDLKRVDPTIEAKGNLKKLQDLSENLGASTKFQHQVIVEG